MKKGNSKGEKGLVKPVMTRITKAKYNELEHIANKTKDETVSGIIRKIVHNRPVKIYIHDETKDLLLEELAAIRSEIKAIGVNINQITRLFNTYPEGKRKEFYAKIALTEYIRMQSKIDKLLLIIGDISKKWLSE